MAEHQKPCIKTPVGVSCPMGEKSSSSNEHFFNTLTFRAVWPCLCAKNQIMVGGCCGCNYSGGAGDGGGGGLLHPGCNFASAQKSPTICLYLPRYGVCAYKLSYIHTPLRKILPPPPTLHPPNPPFLVLFECIFL